MHRQGDNFTFAPVTTDYVKQAVSLKGRTKADIERALRGVLCPFHGISPQKVMFCLQETEIEASRESSDLHASGEAGCAARDEPEEYSLKDIPNNRARKKVAKLMGSLLQYSITSMKEALEETDCNLAGAIILLELDTVTHGSRLPKPKKDITIGEIPDSLLRTALVDLMVKLSDYSVLSIKEALTRTKGNEKDAKALLVSLNPCRYY